MPKKSSATPEPSLTDVIRHTFQKALGHGPEREEAIALLESFGFDPKVAPDALTDEYLLAVLERRSASTIH